MEHSKDPTRDEPAYSEYTVDELRDALSHIDRGAWPERHRRLVEEMEARGHEVADGRLPEAERSLPAERTPAERTPIDPG